LSTVASLAAEYASTALFASACSDTYFTPLCVASATNPSRFNAVVVVSFIVAFIGVVSGIETGVFVLVLVFVFVFISVVIVSVVVSSSSVVVSLTAS
jgi:hypothetical protein|tara:strand:+ start:3687 stop:3977 length:291 start_codon:yes stop_codon:yes gene_type:complete